MSKQRKHNTQIRRWAREIIGLADDIDGQPSTRRAIKTISKLIRDDHPKPKPVPDPTWTREQRLNYVGALWLKRGRTSGGYCADPQYIAQGSIVRARIKEGILAGGGTHAPFLVQNSKQLPDAEGRTLFDLWDDPEHVKLCLRELVDAGIQPVLLAASDKDAREHGIQWVIDNINFAMKHYGHLVSGVIPRIEMDEHPGPWSRADQERVARDTKHARDEHGVVLWAHFLSDIYMHPSGYDGILYQHKRVGDDGVTLREAAHHRHEIGNRDMYHSGPQDRTWASPLRSAIADNWTFVSWEFCQRPADTEQDCKDVLVGIKQGFADVGVEPRWG